MSSAARRVSIHEKLKSINENIKTAEERKRGWDKAARHIFEGLEGYRDNQRYIEVRPPVDPEVYKGKNFVRFRLCKGDQASLDFTMLDNGYVQASIDSYERDENDRQIAKTIGAICSERASSVFAEQMLIVFLDDCLEHHPSTPPQEEVTEA